MSFKLMITKITDPIYLTYELLIGNRRLIFPTMVGLTIALTVISQSNILVESYREEIFEEVVFSSPDLIEGDISIDYYSWFWENFTEDGFSGFFTNIDDYIQLINESIVQTDYSDYILDYFWSARPRIEVWVNSTRWDEPGAVDLVAWDIETLSTSVSEFYDQLEDILEEEGKGHLPESASEIILIRPKRLPWNEYEEFENFTLNTEVNITLPRSWNSELTVWNNKTVKIVGILEYEESYSKRNIDNTTLLLDKYFSGRYNRIWGYNFLTLPSFMIEILEDLSEPPANIGWEGYVIGKIFLDSRNFDAFNVNNEKSKLKKFIISLEDKFKSIDYYIDINSEILNRIEQYQYTILSLMVMLLLVGFPVICIALYLVNYSFGLIRRQKQEQIGIIKTRGGSWLQVFTVLLGEMIISTVLAVLLGFLLSIFLSDIVLRSTNYLEFLGAPVPVRFSMQMIQNLIIWGLSIALILNFIRIIRMSRQDIADTLIPVETREPLWKRYYIDIIIFIVGTVTWIILMYLIQMAYTGVDIGGGYYLIYMLVSLLGIPAPFLIFFGTIMVIARFFPFLMRKSSEFLWKLEGGINAFAIRNIVRHKQAANRAVLLITLAISFSILASSLIFSLDETEQLKLYYEHGADITLDISGPHNKTIVKLLKENVTDITHVSCMYAGEYNDYGIIRRNYEFLFIDPNTYAETAFFSPSFKLSNSLNHLMDQISDNQTLILYKGNLEHNDLELGESIMFYFSNSTSTEERSFEIGGTFKFWPMLYPYASWDLDHHYYLIGSLGMFESLNKSNYLSYFSGKYLAKLDTYFNVEKTIEEISNITNLTPNSPALQFIQYKDDFTRHFSLSILNTDLIICVSVSIIGVIMFAFFTYVERGKEIGVERALGMTRFQTALSFLVEASTILAFGTVIGFITGTYFVTMFLQITQIGVQIPPVVVTYPIPLLIQILLAILIIAGIGTITPAFMATRKDISRILKVE
ncbi:MAG: FtsX-like permease family protein [Candidatus Hodarchaeota archaeon]